jgi:NAD(P)H-quinone oxidoreductase subunit 5
MSGVLVAVPALPLIAAAIVRLARLSPRSAARAVVLASAASTVGALILLISLGIDGSFDGSVEAVVTNSDGAAVVGLMADRVGAILLLLTSLVGLIVQSFASRSLLGDPRATRFHILAAVLTAAASLVGIAATGSGLLVAWVATSVTLVALLGHKAPWPAAVRSQRLTAGSFLVGDLVLLLVMLTAIVAVGDIDLRFVAAEAAALDAETIGSLSVLTVVAVGLVIAGVARSALVPLHGWLPSTLAAPTPVSALLHAGVINGAGVLLLRFAPVFASSVSALALAFGLGVATPCSPRR